MRKKLAQILVVDDQEEILFSAKMILKKHFEIIFTTNSPKKIISILNENDINVIQSSDVVTNKYNYYVLYRLFYN